MTTSHFHVLYCSEKCFGHGKTHLEYSVTDDKRVTLNNNARHIGTLVERTPKILQWLTECYHMLLLRFNPHHAETLPDSRGCDHRIQLTTSEEKLRMGPIYQLSQPEEKVLVLYLDKIIK